MDENMKHGLLVEDFKNSLINIIEQNPLDVQTKAIIVHFIHLELQRLSNEQTKRDLEELKAIQENNKEEVPE